MDVSKFKNKTIEEVIGDEDALKLIFSDGTSCYIISTMYEGLDISWKENNNGSIKI